MTAQAQEIGRERFTSLDRRLMEDLRPVAPHTVAALDSVSDSLSDDRAGQVVRCPRMLKAPTGGCAGIIESKALNAGWPSVVWRVGRPWW